MEAVRAEEDFGSDPEEQEQLIPFHSTTKRGRPRLILKGKTVMKLLRCREAIGESPEPCRVGQLSDIGIESARPGVCLRTVGSAARRTPLLSLRLIV